MTKKLSDDAIIEIAHRQATTYTHRSDPGLHAYGFVKYTLLNFARAIAAAIAQPEQPANLAERIRHEIDHCIVNQLRLVPNFGKRNGDLAVRVSSLEAILETSAQPEQTATCKKCGGVMAPGQAIEQTFGGTNDFIGDKTVCTISPGGPGKLISCMKCRDCGWSTS